MSSGHANPKPETRNLEPVVVLGVGGGIAAYKLCELASRLTQQNHDVHVVMTQAATRFVAPLTFQALTQNPVHTSLWPESTASESGVAAAMAHIDLATRADVVLIAPATADLIARLAHGLADDLLSTLVLATRAPILIAPAMNPAMYEHPATQKNLQTLREYGYQIIEPEVGRMACEHIGPGRLPTTEVLINALVGAQRAAPKNNQSLAGKKVLVTAGPTRENLDPVRFISNRSSGKMGYAIAAEAAARGAQVLLVSGPTNLSTPPRVERVEVTTTQQMFEAVTHHAANCDIIIAAAAPADFTPREMSTQKIKKNRAREQAGLTLELIATPDIVETIAKTKSSSQIIIGFAAETGGGIEEAKRKLKSKNLDAIVYNDVTQAGAGFDVDTNRVMWIDKSTQEEWPLMTKREVAARILDSVLRSMQSI
jgi:phosphopantothenoylcysteine decarboxylase/phosphopantothenate--cysteine ligase